MDMSAFLSAPLQLEKICRACLSEKGDMKPLYGACLDEMLVSFAQIQVKEDDGLPSKMCVQCILQCSRAYTFKQLCEKSENILRNYISPEFQAQLCEVLQQKEQEQQQLEANVVAQVTEEDLHQFSSTVTNVVMEDGLPAQLVTFTDGTTGYFMENVTIVDASITDTDDTSLQDIQEVTILNTPQEDPAYPSDEDNFIAPAPTTIRVTTTSSNPKKFPCTKCDETFDLKVDLKVHMMSHPKELDYLCTICNKSFAEARILKRHSKIHLAKKPHQCDQCEMSFAESSNLSKHKKKHTGELRNTKGKPHLCSVCGRAFKWASSLSKHMKYHTGHKLHTCQFCGKQYVEARSLKIHLRSHTGERPHVCAMCDKAFTQICNLEKHLRIHTGEKPYICNVCGKGFTQSGYVAIHMRTHTGERPYVCHTCGKAFSGSNTLANHQRTHTKEKPCSYACNICGKRFSRLSRHKAHMRMHELDKLISCKECGMSYATSEELHEHVVTVHTPHGCILDMSKVDGVEISDILVGETVHTVQVQTTLN